MGHPVCSPSVPLHRSSSMAEHQSGNDALRQCGARAAQHSWYRAEIGSQQPVFFRPRSAAWTLNYPGRKNKTCGRPGIIGQPLSEADARV
ncbi:hypothetical protein MTO96_030209 [Rhipicephalus appendiculatus]